MSAVQFFKHPCVGIRQNYMISGCLMYQFPRTSDKQPRTCDSLRPMDIHGPWPRKFPETVKDILSAGGK